MNFASSLIPTEVLQNLSHELYEKRKNAALEVEKIMTQLALAGDHDKITAVINLLATEFTNSPQPNHRKGGVIGLAAATIGLASDAAQHLEQIVPPVLYSSSDQNSRVRYYACEALYNIAKVMRGNFIVLCNQIFEALNKLSTDSDPHVQSAACLLDKLVKDIVTEGDHYRFQIFKEEDENQGIKANRLVHIGLTSKEIMLQLEDAECSICLCNYEEVLTVQVLPCTHHFHTMCIVKWLKMEAICPLCKYDIHQGKEHA